jgi:hypothetical protein
MPRVALPDSRSYARYLDVSTLHMFIDGSILDDFRTSQLQLRLRLKTSSCDASFKILIGILGYWALLICGLCEVGTPTRPPRGRSCQTPCSHARRSGCLYMSDDQDHNSIFLLFFWSIKPAMLPASMLGGYSTSASSTPSCFPRRNDLLGNPFLIMSLLDLFFFFSSFLDHHTGHPARHDARILLMSASLMPSEFFRRRFDLGSLLPIGRHSTSLRSARLQTGRLLR